MVFGAIMFMAQLMLDYVIIQQYFNIAVLIRLSVALICIGLTYLTYTTKGRESFGAISCMQVAVASGALCALIVINPSTALLYFTGFIQIALIFVVLMNVSVILTVSLLGAIFCSYALSTMMLPPSINLLGSVIILFNTFVMIGCISIFIERYRRQAFLKHLAKERITLRLKSMIDEASESLQRRNTLMNIITHVFKTPLHQIIGFNELVGRELEEREDADTCKTYVDTVTDASRGLLDQVNRLLTLSRLESGNLLSRTSSFQLKDLVSLSLATIDPQNKHSERFVIDDLPNITVFADPEQIGAALGEILRNALHHGDDGEIYIRVKDNTRTLTLSVENGGPPMTDKQLDLIYEPLSNKIDYRHMGGQSAGIGIGLAHRLSQLNGGRVFVSNRDNGEGVVAKLTMPIADHPSLSAVTAEDARADIKRSA